MASIETTDTKNGPVLLAYDGCGMARFAIKQAGQQLAPGRDAIVLTVWQPADVGFLPVTDRRFDAADAADVKEAAEETAAHGASLAEQAGFRAQPLTIEGAPTWKGIVHVAEEHGASLIVLGSHRRTGIRGRLLGSVAGAVVSHADDISVLVVHRQQEA
ncbi:MAG TPA: universal stress protein [Conexibacter sp.]|jgi:nucleotide-binding universal stress UspA family protein